MRIKLAQFGLGPIGIETLRTASTKTWADIVGAVDIDPGKVERDLGELTGLPALSKKRVYGSFQELVKAKRPDIVLHTAVSSFETAYLQLEPIVKTGVSVVSSCEELVFPQLRNAALASKLDQLCRRYKARVVGTGVNPGFVMDVLPLCLTGVSLEVDSMHITRVVNASTRREPLQRKIGSGQERGAFAKQLLSGEAGHAGLRESLGLVAHCLGWKLDKVAEIAEPVVAKRPIRTRYFEVRKGQVCGIHQRAEGKINGRVRLTLDIKMYLDAKDPYDAIQIEGNPPLDLVMRGGVAGDQATVAALVNTAPRVLNTRPGLLLMTDLPLPVIAPP